MCCSQTSQTVFWFLCNMKLVYFNLLCNVKVPLTITVFPTEAIMSVSGIVVVIIVDMQGLPATIMLFRLNVLSHRWQTSKIRNRWYLC